MNKKVKGIYHGEVVRLLEKGEAKEGEEVEVVFNDEETEKELTSEEKDLLAKTKGKWAGDTRIAEAFKEHNPYTIDLRPKTIRQILGFYDEGIGRSAE